MARFILVPGRSELWAEARSTLHPVRVHTAGLTGEIEAELDGERIRLATPTRIELEPGTLRSGHALVDDALQRRMDSARYPSIRAELVAAEPGAGPDMLRLTGGLTFHGITRTLEVEVTVRLHAGDTLLIEGARPIDMRDFGLPPPSFLMFKVDPLVQVRARLVAMPSLTTR
ncbi:MAG TPA: YceI family protein [Myxococcaceae bacterium]|nr:YceI family protein [Myxococcaceae bacterium]